MDHSKPIYFIEGPDGAGKTTLAKKLAEDLGAHYVHMSAMPRVSFGLARMYVEAMLPALMGYQAVVMDRCWLSEIPYGKVYRGGANRLNPADVRMLERLAYRCGAVVIKCMPPLEECLKNFNARKSVEMLDDDEQLVKVYELYRQWDNTALNVVEYDYTHGEELDMDVVTSMQSRRHPTSLRTAGNWDAYVVLVGDTFAHHKDNDPFYQWPFASFGDAGCSRWLAHQLDSIRFPESDLLWVNADQPLGFLGAGTERKVIALGRIAGDALLQAGVDCVVAPHPQAWKRFHFDKPYKLLNMLRS